MEKVDDGIPQEYLDFDGYLKDGRMTMPLDFHDNDGIDVRVAVEYCKQNGISADQIPDNIMDTLINKRTA